MKLSWPYVAQGTLRSRVNPSRALRLTPDQNEYLINRLFDRCELDVVVQGNGRIALVARKLNARSTGKGDK
jgi:hypothetical protein